LFPTAAALAAAVRSGRISAREAARTALARIAAWDGSLNAFTEVFDAEALAQADALDRDRAAGRPLGALAGVPFAVKNLFDVRGHTTLAGSKNRLGCAPASEDAALVDRFKRAGAVLVGAVNMDEYAYGFVTENAHFGATRNPHALDRIAGGSSGGSAAVVAAGLTALSLGSDTNGSIRIPAGLCGVFGLMPTHGRLPAKGMFPFAPTLDDAGLFARSVEDLALAFDAGLESEDTPITPRLQTLADAPLRAGVLGGWFDRGLTDPVRAALDAVAAALEADRGVLLAEAEAARSAAFCLTAFEGGRLHLSDLRTQLADYDPAVGSRLLAGALSPTELYDAAQGFRRRFTRSVLQQFQTYDVLIAPITLGPAPPIGQETMQMEGEEISIRKNLGVYTQPISFVGAPVLAPPIRTSGLPVGVQIIAAPGREDRAFAAALRLERQGLAAAPPPLPAFTRVSAVQREISIHDHQ
jgi:aspartyl-tRNA(Asn)/glutamyl-tRNA(Gln) amidotransferase subunit A